MGQLKPTIFPDKLKKGDEIRVIAPSRSMAIISPEVQQIANNRFKELGFTFSFGQHVNEIDDFGSTSIASRVEDFHQAFADKNVKAILTVVGGFNSNQLLDYLNWELIKNNPKIFCGFSDITALNNAIFAQTGLVTYSGPHYSTFGQQLHFDYTLDYFQKCLLSEDPFEINSSPSWSDDPWYKDQDHRHLIDGNHFWFINPGTAEGTVVGANLCTLNLLQGTKYFPNISNSILFIEDDSQSDAATFDRDLQSLIHQPHFADVRGIVVGRFQNNSHVTQELLSQIIKSKKELDKLPVVANVDFGHTDPKITFPIGGSATLSASSENIKLVINQH